jgi:O-antigen/teichoic acid export membrane protein
MIARQSSLVIANSVLGAGLGLLTLFIIARYMGQDVYGERAYALALVSLIGIIARLGLPTTHVRRLARGESVAESNGAFLVLKSGLTAAFMLTALACYLLWFDVLHKGVYTTTPTALWVAYWIVVVQSVRDIPVSSFQGLRMIREREAVLFTNTLVTVVLSVWVGIAWADTHGRWSPLPALGRAASSSLGLHAPLGLDEGVNLQMWAFFAGEVAALLVAVVLFLRNRIPVARPHRHLLATYAAFTLPLMLLAVGETVLKNVNQVLLGFWWDARELANFAAPAKITEIFLLLGTGLSIVLLPALSSLHVKGDEDGARRVVLAAERWTSLLLWPVVVVMALIAVPVLHVVLSDQFTGAALPLILLSVQSLVASLVMPVQMLAIGRGSPRFAAQVVVWSLAADVVLAALLVPRAIGPVALAGLGATGAAIAALGGTVFALLLYTLPSRGWRGHPTLRRPQALHFLAAAATFTAFALLRIPTPDRFHWLLLYSIAVAAVYAGILRLVGELRRDDWRAVLDLVGSQTAKSP